MRAGLMAGLSAVVLGIGALGCAPAGPTSHPFEGSTSGSAQFGGKGNHDGLLNAKACNEDQNVPDYYKVTTYTSSDGTEAELGAVHVETAHCNSPQGPQSGQIAFVTASGDVLFGEYLGGGDAGGSAGDPVLVTFMPATTQAQCYLLNALECRSTGRFENATGTVTWVGIPTQTDPDAFVPWSFESEWSGGTLVY